MASDQQRFFRHVIKGPDKSSCWIWTGAISNDGYGVFWRKDPKTGKDSPIKAHRYALSLLQDNQQIPHNLHALHKCDNTICVKATGDSSTHLTLGTREENMLERSYRARANIRGGSREQRADNARILREHVKSYGYSQEMIDTLMRHVISDQGKLF